MTRRDITLLLLLASLWGASFMFIKVAVEDVGPIAVVAARVFLGAAGLLLIARSRGLVPRDFRPRVEGRPSLHFGWFAYLIVGTLGTALPFLLISWGEERIPSGTAGILNATAPLFAAMLAPWWPFRGRESLGRGQIAGLVIGFGGVTVLVVGHSDPSAGLTIDLGAGAGRDALLGELAVLAAALSYALGGLFTRQAFKGRESLVPAVGQTVASALLILPLLLIWGRPDHWPEWKTVGALLTLGIGGTAIALVFYYELIRSVGAPRALMVVYLAAGMAMIYGAVLLGEAITLFAVGGLVLIVAGVVVTTRAGAGRSEPGTENSQAAPAGKRVAVSD